METKQPYPVRTKIFTVSASATNYLEYVIQEGIIIGYDLEDNFLYEVDSDIESYWHHDLVGLTKVDAIWQIMYKLNNLFLSVAREKMDSVMQELSKIQNEQKT